MASALPRSSPACRVASSAGRILAGPKSFQNRTTSFRLPADIAITSIPHLTSIGFPSTLIGYEPRMRSRALGAVGGTIAYLNLPDLPPVPTQMGIYKIELAAT